MCSSSSGRASPAIEAFGQKHLHRFAQKPGAGIVLDQLASTFWRGSRFLLRVRAWRRQGSSPGSSLPAGSSHRKRLAAWRYCRSITIQGSFLSLELSTARITALPLWRTTSRTLFFAARLDESVARDAEQRALVHRLGAEHLGLAARFAVGLAFFGFAGLLLAFAEFHFFGICFGVRRSDRLRFLRHRVCLSPCTGCACQSKSSIPIRSVTPRASIEPSMASFTQPHVRRIASVMQ